MARFGVIYGLYDPRTEKLRYIGQTVRPLKERLKYHLSKHNLAVSQTRCSKWLRSLMSFGLRPLVKVLEEAESREHLDALEIDLIRQARGNGEELVNHADGGLSASGYSLGEDFRRAVSERMSGRKVSPETRAKLSAANKGKKLSYETREKMSLARKGKKLTQEHKAKLSKARKGRPGRPHTEARKAHMSSIMTGRRVNTLEHMQRLSDLRKGTFHTLESKAKMSESAKRRAR